MLFIGIDVQSLRDCPYAVMDASGHVLENGWLPTQDLARACTRLGKRHPGACVGIDAPRQPLDRPREHYWRSDSWGARSNQVGSGRHCEVAIAALRLANPQWTPLADKAPEWMRLGFRIFTAFGRCGDIRTFEVFPSASYAQLEADTTAEITMPLRGFLSGPKDMLDAVVAAYSVKEYIAGRGMAVGGGDGLGEIILPRPVAEPGHPVLQWPVG
jgi:hypothetical protein